MKILQQKIEYESYQEYHDCKYDMYDDGFEEGTVTSYYKTGKIVVIWKKIDMKGKTK